MYELLQDIAHRPKPFSRYTAMELWNRPHLARQFLSTHLNQETDRASHRFETIDQVVTWIDSQLHLSEKSLCDLGCGPGLYTQRFSNKGADVTGVDFSALSLEYADLSAKENDQSWPLALSASANRAAAKRTVADKALSLGKPQLSARSGH